MVRSPGDPPPAAACLRSLSHAIAVVDEGGVEVAARRRGVAPGEIARAVADVERLAGVRLLDRESEAGIPTGEAHQFVSDLRRAVARRSSRPARGRDAALRVGFPPYLGIERLHEFLTRMGDLDPALKVEISHRVSGEQIARLRNGFLDFGVLRAVRLEPGLTLEPLFPGAPMAAFIAADHPLAARSAITPADVGEQDLFMPSRTLSPPTFDWWLAALARAGYRFRHVHDDVGTQPYDLVARAVQGDGVAIAMDDFVPVESLGTRVVTRTLIPPLPLAQTVLAWPAERSPEIDHVVAVAREAARALKPRGAPPTEGERSPSRRTLTRRELEILCLAAEGLSGPLIASRLTISLATVRSHFDNIYRKLGTGDRAGAVATAFRRGVIK